MLVEFSVENFKSIGEMQTLYMQPATTRKSDRYVLDTGVPCEPQVMPVVTILGANASGKSTFIEAFKYVDRIVQSSAERKKSALFEDKRFKLNPKYKEKPTRFMMTFVGKDKALYTYRIGLFPEGITEEKLVKVEKGCNEKVVLIERSETKTALDKSIHPDEAFLRVWRADINDKQTFLSYLGNKGEVSIFDSVLEWFSNLVYVSDTLPSFLTSKVLVNSAQAQEAVCQLMNDADIHIKKLIVEEKDEVIPDKVASLIAASIAHKREESEEEILDKIHERKSFNVSFYHQTTDGNEIPFDFESEESKGTKVYYSLAGMLLGTLFTGDCLVVDELENSLHPYLLRRIVQLFTNPETNPNGAQLIFTTHDVTVMDKTLLHPDQIYFTEKDKETYETSLVNLIDYKSIGAVGKKDRGKDLYKYYLEGRFGAVPEVNWG